MNTPSYATKTLLNVTVLLSDETLGALPGALAFALARIAREPDEDTDRATKYLEELSLALRTAHSRSVIDRR